MFNAIKSCPICGQPIHGDFKLIKYKGVADMYGLHNECCAKYEKVVGQGSGFPYSREEIRARTFGEPITTEIENCSVKAQQQYEKAIKLKKAKPLIIIGAIAVFVIIILIASSGGGGSSSSRSTATCKSCGRVYEAGDSGGNFKNIARTGMCKNCYENFKWGQKAIGK